MTVYINGKKYECPACWEELSTETYQRIIREWDPEEFDVAKRNYFKLFCILTNTSFKEVQETPENEINIYQAIQWFVEHDFRFHEELPKALEIAGQRIAIPRKLGHMSIGQMIHIKRTLREGQRIEAVVSKVVATVLQPIIDGKPFDPDRADEIEKEVLKMPITLMAPIGFFSVRRAINYGRKPTNVLRRIQSSLGQMFDGMLRKWRKYDGFTRLMTSP